ncbi:hypothetical protein [Pseudomonas tolaasii]
MEKVITIQQVAEAFKADVESFFGKDNNFQLRIEGGGVSPVCIGSGEKARIVIPYDILAQYVEAGKDMAFILIVLGHEAAHYLNRHNEHVDQSHAETRALEMWADFFGIKLALVAITFGENLQKISAGLPGWHSSDGRTDAIAEALASLSGSYFAVKHESYPSAATRVATCIAGALSFFEIVYKIQDGVKAGVAGYLHAINPETIVKRALGLQQRIYNNSVICALHSNSEDAVLDSEQIETIHSVHKSIQGAQSAMFDGMETIPALWLRLNYGVGDEERRATAKQRATLMRETLNRLGINAAPSDQKKAQ